MATDSDTDAAIRLVGGGSAANTAAWLASLGTRVDLVAVVGADAAGRERIAELESAGVGCRYVRRTDAAATGTVVVLAQRSHRTMIRDRGANLLLTAADVDEALAGADHLHLSGYTLLDPASRPAGLHALWQARRLGISTSVDAASAAPIGAIGGGAVRGWIQGVDVLFANLDEARALVEHDGAAPISFAGSPQLLEGIASDLARSVRHAVVKLGADGAIWVNDTGYRYQPAQPAQVVDPTGAGDAFAAGFLQSFTAGDEPTMTLGRAVSCGAHAVNLVGGRPPP